MEISHDILSYILTGPGCKNTVHNNILNVGVRRAQTDSLDIAGRARDVATLRVPTESVITRSKGRGLLNKRAISSFRVMHEMIQQE